MSNIIKSKLDNIDVSDVHEYYVKLGKVREFLRKNEYEVKTSLGPRDSMKMISDLVKKHNTDIDLMYETRRGQV